MYFYKWHFRIWLNYFRIVSWTHSLNYRVQADMNPFISEVLYLLWVWIFCCCHSRSEFCLYLKIHADVKLNVQSLYTEQIKLIDSLLVAHKKGIARTYIVSKKGLNVTVWKKFKLDDGKGFAWRIFYSFHLQSVNAFTLIGIRKRRR